MMVMVMETYKKLKRMAVPVSKNAFEMKKMMVNRLSTQSVKFDLRKIYSKSFY